MHPNSLEAVEVVLERSKLPVVPVVSAKLVDFEANSADDYFVTGNQEVVAAVVLVVLIWPPYAFFSDFDAEQANKGQSVD